MLDVRCWMFEVRCWMFEVRCWMLDVGCSMFDVRCSMFDVHPPIGSRRAALLHTPNYRIYHWPFFTPFLRSTHMNPIRALAVLAAALPVLAAGEPQTLRPQ